MEFYGRSKLIINRSYQRKTEENYKPLGSQTKSSHWRISKNINASENCIPAAEEPSIVWVFLKKLSWFSCYSYVLVSFCFLNPIDHYSSSPFKVAYPKQRLENCVRECKSQAFQSGGRGVARRTKFLSNPKGHDSKLWSYLCFLQGNTNPHKFTITN